MATVQLGTERINPGGTLELLGDMTAEGAVEISLVADSDGATRSLGTVSADDAGHFQTFLVVPNDLPGGSYAVHARSAVDAVSVPLVIAGLPVAAGEEGHLPGQDEAFAGAGSAVPAASAGAVAVASSRSVSPAPVTPPPKAWLILVAATGGVAAAFAMGAIVRRRSSGRANR